MTYSNNICPLSPGDRVILTNEGLSRFPRFNDRDIFTVTKTAGEHVYVLPRRFAHQSPVHIARQFFECEHDSHCAKCGVGQCDIGSGKPNQKDDLTMCERSQQDICGNCHCDCKPGTCKCAPTCDHDEDDCATCLEEERQRTFPDLVHCDKCNVTYNVKLCRAECPHSHPMIHQSEPAFYKEPESFMAHASTEKGKGITHYCEQIRGDNVARIESAKSYRAPWSSPQEDQMFDLLLMLAYENNALRDRLSKVETVCKKTAHKVLMMEADERPAESIERDDDYEQTVINEYDKTVREGLS